MVVIHSFNVFSVRDVEFNFHSYLNLNNWPTMGMRWGHGRKVVVIIIKESIIRKKSPGIQ